MARALAGRLRREIYQFQYDFYKSLFAAVIISACMKQ
jgi:hypothetical protein